MKKNILGIIFITALFLRFVFFLPSVKAQTPDADKVESNIREAISSLYSGEIPLLDCGVAGDKERNKCCSREIYENLKEALNEDASLPGLLNKAFEKFGSLVMGRVYKVERLKDAIGNMDKDVDPPKCFNGVPDDPNNPSCTCVSPEELVSKPVKVQKILEFCQKYIPASNEREMNRCVDCFLDGGYFSAIDCLYFQPDRFILSNVFGLGLKLGGLFAFLCLIYSAIEIQISQDNKEKIKAAQERITACIIGLLVVIFSIFILKLVGVNILGIPGLG